MTSRLIFLLLVLSVEDQSYLHLYFRFNITLQYLILH